MSDKYGYIGIETLLNFCSNDKNHCVTPNDFMRMNRVKIDERPHSEWIPCSERLPNAEYGESNSVLCQLENDTMKVLYWDGGNWCYPTGELYHSVNHKNGWHNRVVAWMPLPTPYRKEGE